MFLSLPMAICGEEEPEMKQLGNLAIVCARRQDVVLCLSKGTAQLSVEGFGRIFDAPWDDDSRIEAIIHELNFGNYSKKGKEVAA